MILEPFPHQQAPQVRMTREHDPEQVENLALLKFSRPPHRRERWQLHLVGAVPVRIRNTTGPCFLAIEYR